MGNGSALEVVLHNYALYKSTFTLLYFTPDKLTIIKYAEVHENGAAERQFDGDLVTLSWSPAMTMTSHTLTIPRVYITHLAYIKAILIAHRDHPQ